LNAFVHEFLSGRVIGVEAVVSIDVNFPDLVLEDFSMSATPFRSTRLRRNGWFSQPQLKSWTNMPGFNFSALTFLIIRYSNGCNRGVADFLTWTIFDIAKKPRLLNPATGTRLPGNPLRFF
jgi:hypothetical protein